jgi:hypothetical protein
MSRATVFLTPETVRGTERSFQIPVVTRRLQCAVKGAGPQREINPPPGASREVSNAQLCAFFDPLCDDH